MATKSSSQDDINDKVILITGANTGIGYATAAVLAAKGAYIIIACRSEGRGKEAVNKLKEETKSEKVYLELLDLADLASVRDFANRFTAHWDRLHILINNAGLVNEKRELTTDSFELTFGVNHLGHFLLTNLLLDLLKKSAPSRIVNVASKAYLMGKMHWDDLMLEKDYGLMKAYSQSKLANILFTIELAKRLEGSGVSAVSLHPGTVQTQIFNNMSSGILSSIFKFGVKLVGIKPEDGAKTSIYCALDSSIPEKNGCYFSDAKVEKLNDRIKNSNDAKKLWDLSVKLTGLEA